MFFRRPATTLLVLAPALAVVGCGTQRATSEAGHRTASATEPRTTAVTEPRAAMMTEPRGSDLDSAYGVRGQ